MKQTIYVRPHLAIDVVVEEDKPVLYLRNPSIDENLVVVYTDEVLDLREALAEAACLALELWEEDLSGKLLGPQSPGHRAGLVKE